MILTETFSEVGRCTEQHLDNLRRQLGVGIDPAYDYSHMTELQRQLTSKKDKKPKDDGLTGHTPLDRLRQALYESTNPAAAPGEEPEAAGNEAAAPGQAGGQHAVRQCRRPANPSWMFKATSRNSLYKLDLENRFRAPPVGSYKPKVEVLEPRVKDVTFGWKEPTRSKHVVDLEREVEQLKEQGQPYDHLLRPLVSVELLDEKPERPKRRMKEWSFAKDLERPDLIRTSGIVFNHNTFTGGVLQGDLCTSDRVRRPVHDFAKTSTSEDRPRETFFQPGQYKVNLASSRPTSEVKNIPFGRQTDRKPLRETVGRVEIKSRAGDHLPDRSLSRSCPVLSTAKRLMVPAFEKYTERPPIIKIRPGQSEGFSLLEPSQEIDLPAPSFDTCLTRQGHFKTQRSYGENVLLQRAKENLRDGPTSVELLAEVGNSPSLRPRVLSCDFERMGPRGKNERKHAEPAPRSRDMGGAMRFARASREGDARPDRAGLSLTADVIGRLRAVRTYDGVSAADISD